ncbi:MAG: homocitrate synthase [Cyanobacteriota bacterium]|nr:homocitrate synthase [Cyanobacteriota bacterium]
MSLTNFFIVDSTLREGEQCPRVNFSTEQKIEIAYSLAEFGVEFIELTSPVASPRSRQDCLKISSLGLPCKIVTHIRCHSEDAQIAIDSGVNGINIAIGTSRLLREHGHGKNINQIIDLATEVITYIHSQNPNLIIRFSAEDSFRSSFQDLLSVFLPIQKLEMIHRIGIADTVGIATPFQVYSLIKSLRQLVGSAMDIEFHGHNDTGCAVANSHSALEAGATHIDTTILGIGERNGITSLAGFISRMYTISYESVSRYNLKKLVPLHNLLSEMIGIPIPFNHCIVGESAFIHKAGIHSKAVLSNPQSYESIDPMVFGLDRQIITNHRLTGWNAIADRANQLGLNLDVDEIRQLTLYIKQLADQKLLTQNDVDQILLDASI